MNLRKFVGLFVVTLGVCAASFTMANIPDLGNSHAELAYTGSETAVMFNVPNGGGDAFTSASTIGGTVDATITLTILISDDTPVANFPFEDCWLESADGGLVSCTGGATADFNTDASGKTTWGSPLQAGGSSEALTVVYISGSALTTGAGLAISHNSADINGDGAVNLTDVPLFADDFHGGSYVFRLDFVFDGAVNLSDVVRFAQALGATCP